MHFEDLFEALHMPLRLVKVRQKALLQLRIGRLICHFGQRLGELLLGIVDVLQLMHEQVVDGFDVLGEQSHRSNPHASGTQQRRLELQACSSLCSIADPALTDGWRGRSSRAEMLALEQGLPHRGLAKCGR
jgi:hypothetical protein